VLPVTRPPLDDGAVLVHGGRIMEVGRWRDLRKYSQTLHLDLGDSLLLPGLVNAHCHLDYTSMAGQFPPPRSFTDWLKQITETKSGWDLADYRESWATGAAMLLRSGVTTVGDIEAVPELLPWGWRTTPLRVISFIEMIGITGRRSPDQILEEALKKIASLDKASHPCSAHLSPHAPYSTLPALLTQSAAAARQLGLRLCTHVAESAIEMQMFTAARGEMFEWLHRSGRDASDCGIGSPVRHLDRCGLLSANVLAVHGNYLARGDAGLLARRQVSIAHCPRSHYYFRHEPFPLRRLLRAGVNVCLGTDSLASVVKTGRQPLALDMFAEMRALARTHSSLQPARILKMGTTNAARGLGLEGKVGEISAGAWADLIALPASSPSSNVYESIVHSQHTVTASMIGGRWVLPPEAAVDSEKS
jgi:cytosine/adenosine deaminase-related metal-dependent hydrolase